jgi:hypothetical protein
LSEKDLLPPKKTFRTYILAIKLKFSVQYVLIAKLLNMYAHLLKKY